jgi:3-phosphoshikimate 1-carboxyvinyltransferase
VRAERMGVPCGDVVCARKDDAPLVGAHVTAAHAPSLIDEVPALVVVAIHAGGVTRIDGVGELRHKESDRLARLVELAQAFGADASASNKGALEVRGRMQAGPAFAKVRTDGDHRIAMAAMALARIDGCDLELDDKRAVDTSFPGFQRALAAVDRGGVVDSDPARS